MQLQFNDASQNINAPSATVLDINATDEIELNATAVDLNANLDVSGTTLLPTLGVITAKDLGVGIHVRTADSGASVANDADELVIENSGDAGLSILSGTGNYGTIRFGDSGDNDIAGIEYNHNGNLMKILAGANAVCNITSAGFVFNEDSDDNDFRVETNGLTHALFLSNDNTLMVGTDTANSDVGGMTLNQGATDTNIIAMQSSDVAHGFTSLVATSTYGNLHKVSGTDGGLSINGYHEGQGFGVQITALCKTAGYTANSTAGYGHLDFIARGSDGSTGHNALGADENVMSVRNGNDVKFIVKGDGDIYYDGADQGAYDNYDDAMLVRSWDLSHNKNVINSTFDKYVKYNHETLANANLVGREEDGTPNHFVNVTGMQRLHNGAIWQQYEKHNQLLEAVYELAKVAVGEEKANAILDKHEVKRLN